MNLPLIKNIEAIEAIPNNLVLEYLGVSILLGFALMLVSVYTGYKASKELLQNEPAPEPTPANITTTSKIPQKPLTVSELIFGSSNVLFLCFGMTGIMILVNNNLARAFAIGAAIAVVRFRIKFDSQGLASALFFGVLVGMACGVGQLFTAVLLTIAYGMLQYFVVLLVKFVK